MTRALRPPARLEFRLPRRVVGSIAAGFGVAALAVAWIANPDLSADTVAALAPVVRALGQVGPVAVGALVAACVVHYLAAAIAARAAFGVRLGISELVLAQFAASAANRVTPAGVGGSALLARVFARRADLSVTQAAGAVTALAVLGGVADAIVLSVVVVVAIWTGSSAAGAGTLWHHLLGMVPVPGATVGYALAAVAGAAVVLGVVLRARLGRHVREGLRTARALALVGLDVLRHPGRAAALMSASAATTLVLAAGFATTAIASSGGLPMRSFLALMVGFMLASAAGNALPTPGGIGSADAAQAAVLVAAGASLPASVASVLVFRLVTFWAPALLGVGAARSLRRRGAL